MKDTRGRSVIALICILCACALAALAIPFVAFKRPRNDPPAASMTFASAPKPTPFWKTENYQIESRAIALTPGQVWWQPLRVEKDWHEPRLVGRFNVQGGGRNDIYACVTDADGLTNLRNGNQYLQWYDSGRVTVATINARLPVGQTYFVFSNKYSWFSNKAITFDLRVEYERLVQP